ncbi:hypothetical protein ACFQJC_17125 [Haloferax namakaokahaiae]|uniref:DUF7344 domain-containing protein n=1 Tax=Haloferax namakaokahaiae TaxID=1748331 RepID=A0ABD5ZJ74_9EURY
MSDENEDVSALRPREVEPELHEVFKLFYEERRRLIVGILALQPSGMELEDIATHIAMLEPKRDASKRADVNNVKHLLENHVDKLSAQGVVKFNGEVVTPGPAFKNLYRPYCIITADWVHGRFVDVRV